MLRIMITDGPTEQRWILQGRLVAPWLAEFEKSWNSRNRSDVRKRVVDLSEVTLIDRQGEKLLKTMRRAGAELIACGVYLRHVVEVINGECSPSESPSESSLRSVRRKIAPPARKHRGGQA